MLQIEEIVMNRRMFPLAVALGLLATSLAYRPLAMAGCEECRSQCDQIPMATEDCLQLYCSECAGASVPTGGWQISAPR